MRVVKRTHLIVNDFSSHARALRAHIDVRFADPRSATGDRFVWDYWHIPGQYTHLRTPAYLYFPERLYASFHRDLVQWGRRTLGCHDVSPTWLSAYVDGCRQELHGDLPHGPFAFVFSLTPWKNRVFRGGETLIVQDDVLDYWSSFTSVRSVEEPDILHAIEPRFNRLTVFDPRVPHGVRRVEGTHDPREGRMVLHGWFVQPRPFIEGPLSRSALQARVEELLAKLPSLLGHLEPVGVLSVRLDVDPDGTVRAVRVLCDTLRVARSEQVALAAFTRGVLRSLRAVRFPKTKMPSRVTLPLVFER
mgnify:CR=1 FL=1